MNHSTINGDDSPLSSKQQAAATIAAAEGMVRCESSHTRFHVDKVDAVDELLMTPTAERKTSTSTMNNGRFQVTTESSSQVDIIGSAIAAAAAASAAAAGRSVHFSVGEDSDAARAQQRNDSTSTNNDSTTQFNFRSWR